MKKFCILAAGKGTRNRSIDGLHKALLPLENIPVISHIINKLHNDTEIVIALGYKAEQIESYLMVTHPYRKFTFVKVDNYDGPGAGPGHSLLCCKSYLQEPFVVSPADTLIDQDINIMDVGENWLGVGEVSVGNSIKYCLAKGSKYLDALYYGTGTQVYVGVAGIYDYKSYWKALEEHTIIKDEYQVIHGFDGLERIKLINFAWYDTGNSESYSETRKIYNNDIVANKNNEALFIDHGKVVKYFSDSKKIDDRISRTSHLNENCPLVNKVNSNMYYYDYVDGKLLSEITDENVMLQFLQNCHENLFIKQRKDSEFRKNCVSMYEKKTRERIKPLIGSDLDNLTKINGINVKPVSEMLDLVCWKLIYWQAKPSLFHGDLQPENVLYDSKNNKFVLIDWRDKFGESLIVGDAHYDLGKLYHNLMIDGQSMLKDLFGYSINNTEASITFHVKSNLMYFTDMLEKFCDDNGYVWRTIKLIGILQYLNTCTLYDDFKDGEYGKFLFLYGKYSLSKFLNAYGVLHE